MVDEQPSPTTLASEDLELTEMLCFDLYAASRAVTAVYRPLLAARGLTYPQYLVLVVLWQAAPRTVKQLSEALRLDYGTLTPLLRRMESNGLISRERRLDDERSVNIELTAAGTAMRAAIPSIRGAIGSAVGLDEKHAAALQLTLRSVSASANAYVAAGESEDTSDAA